MYARVATFEGGDVDRLRKRNEEMRASGQLQFPAGMKRALLLDDRQGGRRLFVTFFDSRESVQAAEAEFERMGDDIPEDVRGRRLSVDVYEVAFDESV